MADVSKPSLLRILDSEERALSPKWYRRHQSFALVLVATFAAVAIFSLAQGEFGRALTDLFVILYLLQTLRAERLLVQKAALRKELDEVRGA